MPRARKHQVCIADTPFYHVMSRCVRRAFLCGRDRVSGRSYEHRRTWIEHRLRLLSSLFSIEVCAYAVMSNHYHIVLKLNPSEADGWTDDEVLRRWTTLFRGPLLVQKYGQGVELSELETETLKDCVSVFRHRLADLSWFMKCLNEPIARQANAEDQCTGHFWEARFVSQALKTEQALFAAMAYVDLNPIRAGIAKTPEHSEYTSIKARMTQPATNEQLRSTINEMRENHEINHTLRIVKPLMPFSDTGTTKNTEKASSTLPMRWTEYLKLVDTTGRVAVRGKRGRMDPNLAPVLQRLGMTDAEWLSAASQFRQHYCRGEIRLAKAN